MSKPTNEYGLSRDHQKFCEIYLTKDFYGNGIQSYAEAYNIDITETKGYNTCKVNASKLLTNPNILLYINKSLDAVGFNDAFIDKQLLFIVQQNADFGSKLGAVKEYNKLKQRIEEKIALKVEGYDVTLNLNKKTS